MGSNRPNRNRSDQTTADRALLEGLLTHAATIPSAVISGVFMTTEDMVARLQERLDSAQAVVSTRAAWLAAAQAEKAERARTRTYVSGVRQAMIVAFGQQVDTLAEFGLTAPALHVRTPEEKLAVAEKSRATRAARHTMGSKQRAAIKGTAAIEPPPAADSQDIEG